MNHVIFETTVDLPVKKVWELFTDPESYPKYFKYIKKVFYKNKMKKGFIWFDLATVVYIPAIVMHKVVAFEEEKRIEFYVPLPMIGKIIETIELSPKDKKTYVKAKVSYDYGPFFGMLFNKIFERRFKEMIEEGIIKAKRDLENRPLD